MESHEFVELKEPMYFPDCSYFSVYLLLFFNFFFIILLMFIDKHLIFYLLPFSLFDLYN